MEKPYIYVAPTREQERDSNGDLRTFSPSDLLLFQGEGIDLENNPQLKDYIETEWSKYIKMKIDRGDPAPNAGELVRVSRMPVMRSDGKIELYLGPADYKQHITTNFITDEVSRKLGYGENANVMNSMAILVTADNQLCYTLRGKTATFDGKRSGFGIALKSHKDILEKGPQYLFDYVRGAATEELGIAEEEVDFKLGGFAYIDGVFPDKVHYRGFHAPLWIASTKLEKGQLEERLEKHPRKMITYGKDAKKYQGFGFVELKEGPFNEFFRNPNTMPITLPMLEWLGRREGLME